MLILGMGKGAKGEYFGGDSWALPPNGGRVPVEVAAGGEGGCWKGGRLKGPLGQD